MIRSLRKKFVFVAMCSTFAVLLVIMGTILVINYKGIVQRADRLLQIMEENGGELPREAFGQPGGQPQGEDGEFTEERDYSGEELSQGRPELDRSREREDWEPMLFSPETPFETRYFSVTLDDDGKVLETQTNNVAAVSKEAAEIFGETVWKKGKETGFYQSYRYKQISQEEGTMILFVDCARELESFRNFLATSVMVSFLGLFLVLILVLFFSRIIFKPVAESYEKQKQFITDASHELKTPLTIIDANTEVLEMVQGESEWTSSIRNQVKRLASLTQQMVTLTRMEEGGQKGEMCVLPLSKTVREAAEPFLFLAEYQGKKLELKIQENIFCRGEEKQIEQLISLLLDNSVKYSTPESTISLILEKKGKKAILSVTNPSETIQKGDLSILFERFYRTDASRNSETGGSGIGLSVAKAIVAAHKGKIAAYSQDGCSVAVAVTIPCRES